MEFAKKYDRILKKGIGDFVDIILERDSEPRIVEIPDDFFFALEPYPELKLIFDNYSYSHKKNTLTGLHQQRSRIHFNEE